MHEFSISTSGTSDILYEDLTSAAQALVADETDNIANMANISALIWQYLPDLNWAGFYRVINNELVLGPFQGKSACIRIEIGKGVCGTVAATGQAQCVGDVHAFPGHIACDVDSRSELVLPVKQGENVVAVLDLDSPIPDRFSVDDQTGLTKLINSIAPALLPTAG